MDRDLLWAAIALVLVFEGLVPLVAPARWRRTVTQLTQMRDGQLRFFGLVCVIFGLILLVVVTS